MKNSEFESIRAGLTRAVTRYARSQENRKSYNRYALGQYLIRMDEICRAVECGEATLARALYDNFNDRLLTYLEKAAGVKITYGGGAADKGCPK
jgi:AraC-like DNA-binding protein